MAELWAKIVGWTKFIVVTVIVAYLGLVFYKNKEVRVSPRLDFIFLDWEQPRVLNVIAVTAVCSIVGWWLLLMIFRTLRQISRARARSRTDRLERDMAENARQGRDASDQADIPHSASGYGDALALKFHRSCATAQQTMQQTGMPFIIMQHMQPGIIMSVMQSQHA